MMKDGSVYISRVPDGPLAQQAYAMAKASRSKANIVEAMAQTDGDNTKRFLDQNYAAYGHASIADLAHLAMGIEGISLLAAMHLVHQPLWDGQERSTRFQGMEASGWYNPFSELGETSAEFVPHQAFEAAMETAMANYVQVGQLTLECLTKAYPQGDPAVLRSRSRDVSRLLLPLAMKTGVNQVLSARAMTYQIARLRSEEYRMALPELGQVAKWLEVYGEKEAPSLIRHTEKLWWESQVEPSWAAARFPTAYPAAHPETMPVNSQPFGGGDTALPDRLWDSLWTFATVPGTGGLRFVMNWAAATSDKDVILRTLAQMPDHATVPWWFRTGPITFDCALDIGSYRDMQRHRRMLSILEPLVPNESSVFNIVPAYWVADTCLGAAKDDWIATVAPVYEAHGEFLCQAASNLATSYLLPLGTLARAVFSMDWEEAAYVVALRTKAPGHGLYRAFTRGWAHLLKERQSGLPVESMATRSFHSVASLLRTTPPRSDDLLARK